MSDADDIVNNALDADKPSHYINWLSRKTELGDLDTVRFSVGIYTTGDTELVDNAHELKIDVYNNEVYDQLDRDYALIEANALALLRNYGLTVQDEGHNNDSARVASLWFNDIGIKAGNVHRVIAAADGEPVSTTSGTITSLFPNAEDILYQNVSEIGRQLIDVTIEFSGTDLLEEWVALNLTESVDNPDDAEAFMQHMDTDWQEILTSHGFVPFTYHHEFHSLVRVYKNIVFGTDYPVEISAQPGWEGIEPRLSVAYSSDRGAPDYIRFYFGVTTFTLDIPLFVLPVFLNRFIPLSVALEQQFLDTKDSRRGSDPIFIDQLNQAARRVASVLHIKESVDEPNPDDPGAFMKHYRSWMDVFEQAGCTKDETNAAQFWKKIEGQGCSYAIWVQVKGVLWIIVQRLNSIYGTRLFRCEFDFHEGQELLLVKQFQELNALLTKAAAERSDYNTIDSIVLLRQSRHKKAQAKILRYGESADNAAPDPDDPADVLRSHQHGLIIPELTRLQFKPSTTGEEVRMFDEFSIKKFWYKHYMATDGNKHALGLLFYGGTSGEMRIAVWCPINKAWSNKLVTVVPKTAAHMAAVIRDLNTAMERSAADSLAYDPEMETLERVVNHHNQWYDELLQGVKF